MKTRDLIIATAVIYDGDWEKMLDSFARKEHIPPETVFSIVSNLKCQTLTMLDDNYPSYLKEMHRPPFVLFYEGDISLIEDPTKCLSVVGTRKPSEKGIKVTKEIVEQTCKKYITVSGLASGIDRIAHKTTIESGGKTVAVLGSGIDYCFPNENRDIFKKIKKDHLLISEYPPGSQPKSEHFPFRNRLIAAFSKGILITESKIRSGTSITASFGLLFGRDVMCLPSSEYNESGCNKFIKEGASLVENADDVLFIMQ